MIFSLLLRNRSFHISAFCSRGFQHPKFSNSNKQRIRLFAGESIAKVTDESLGEARRQFQEAVELYETNVQGTPPNVDSILRELEKEASEADFWESSNQARNAHVTSQISRYSRLVARLTEWESLKGDGEVAVEMLKDAELFSMEEKQSLLEELKIASDKLLEDGKQYELELLMSGPYDDQPCRILLTAGAGGTEANDWVADLRRMYERHASKMGFTVTLEDEQAGEVVGFKSVELIVNGGANPYGWFKVNFIGIDAFVLVGLEL